MSHESRKSAVLRSFIDYCTAHPHERFWQALRNWSCYHFIMAVDGVEYRQAHDTFYLEGRRHDE